MSLTHAEHRGYLADVVRLAAYRQAISAVVKRGDVVLDLGSGTGVLGLMAAQAGAARVYGVDASPMLGVARSITRANGFDDRITLLKEHSLKVVLPERVDVVIADQLGAFGIEAGVFGAYADARRRHLKPGGAMIPSHVSLVGAPITSAALWADVSFWDSPADGIDLAAMSSHARNVRYYTTSDPADLLGAPATLARLDPGEPDATPIHAAGAFTIERPGTLHGIAGWFSAELAPGVVLTNSPATTERVTRSHVVFPVAEPVAVVAGDVVELDLHTVPPDELHRWTITVRDAAGAEKARSSHSTLDGMPLCKEDLMRQRPDHVPQLGPRGLARRTTLSLMDGERRLEEIEQAVWAQHGDLFGSPAAAAAFVSQVVAHEDA